VEENDGSCSTVTTSASHDAFGYPCVDRGAVEDAFQQHPNLTVHAMGLGSDVSSEELSFVASRGRGEVVQEADTAKVRSLFDEALKEFIEYQARTTDIPQSRAEYTFGIVVERRAPAPSDELIGYAFCSFLYSTDTGYRTETLAGDGCRVLGG